MGKIGRIMYFVVVVPLVLLITGCSDSGESEGGIEVGADAPGFSLANAAGDEVALSDYDGKPVLLYFHMAVG